MKVDKSSKLINEYYHRKLTIKVCIETNRIDEKLKSLNRLREHKAVEDLIKTIDYQIDALFKKL